MNENKNQKKLDRKGTYYINVERMSKAGVKYNNLTNTQKKITLRLLNPMFNKILNLLLRKAGL